MSNLCVCVRVGVSEHRVVCELQPSGNQSEGPVIVTVGAAEPGKSSQVFTYQVRAPLHY